MSTVRSNILKIKERIRRAAERAGRNRDEIELVAVSKRVSAEKIVEAAESGHLLFGENYLQEARDKFSAPPLHSLVNLKLHFIGHLQTNKAKEAIRLFQVIETVDRLKLALTLEKHLAGTEKKQDIFIQINIGREAQKSGILPEDAPKLLSRIQECSHLNIRGLMTIPPFNQDPEAGRPYFRAMKKLSQTLVQQDLLDKDGSAGLSMGMSNDFEVAIEEGSTLIRVGTAIFGQRI